jgi:hypothetical protein
MSTQLLLFVLRASLLIVSVTPKQELRDNCPDKKETDNCPKVCFDAPNCDAELGKQVGDVFKWKLDEGKYGISSKAFYCDIDSS